MRDKNIAEKLAHANSKYQDLMTLLFSSKVNNNKLENVAHIVGDILSNTTECFDYCVRDIWEQIILPNIANKKEVKIYFPFYNKQLKKEPFLTLKNLRPDLYKFLEDFANDAQTKEFINKTEIPNSFPRHIRELVNYKKHDDVLEINNEGSPELVADMGELKIMFPLEQGGNTNTTINNVNEKHHIVISNGYVLRETGEEVMELCIFALSSTRIILNKIYNDFLGSSVKFT